MKKDKYKKADTTKKKKYVSSDFVEYPDIIPFTSFSPISIECPPQDFDLHCPPQFIPKRIPNPPTERDQESLPLPKKSKIRKNNITQKKDILFHFSSKELPSSKNIIPDFDVVKPIKTQALVSTDGVRQVIQYRQPKIIELLTPHLKSTTTTSTLQTNQHDDISFPPTHISLSFNEKPLEYEKYVNYLFHSVMAPSHQIDDFDIGLAKPPLRNQKGPQPPLPTVPPITNISLLDSTLSSYEKLNLDPNHCNIYDTDFEATFYQIQRDNKSRYITNASHLSLLEGEFIVVECIDRIPIIRPLIGMSAQLNVIIDAKENIHLEQKHPYDKRIPVTQITSTSIQPFIAPIPKDIFVLQLSSSVSTSAISPHKSRTTDFILVPNVEKQMDRQESLYLLPMPELTYLSTSPESTVIIPRPKFRKIESYLNQFYEDPLPSAEELCKARSIVEGILDLASKNIERISPPATTLAIMEKLSSFPPRMRALVGQYIRNLRETPWIRSNVITRARLGLTKSVAEIINVDTHKNENFALKNDQQNQNNSEKNKKNNERKKMLMESKEKLRSELADSFENNLMFIQSNTENENDMMMDLTFMDEDDDENWNEILDDLELDDVKKMENDPVISKTKINWDALGLGNLPKRKVMKVIDYQLVDEKVVSSVRWIRNQNEIRDNLKKKSRSRRYQAPKSED